MVKLRINLFSDELQLFRFVSGSACTSFLIFLLTAAGLAKTFWLCALALILIAAAWFAKAPPGETAPFTPRPRLTVWLVSVGLSVFALFYLINALAPETSPDGMSYHLPLVKQYLSQRGFGRITDNIYASFPEAIEMLFLMAFSIGRHSAAALVELAFLLALPLLMWTYARRFGYGSAGLTAAVMVFLSPLFAVDGTSAYNDVAATCVVFSVFYLLRVWETDKKPALLIVIGLLAGFGYGIKYPLFLALPYAAALVLWKLRARPKEGLKAAAVISASAALMILPWVIKNWLTVDNPFSPFLNRFFPNPFVTVLFEKAYLASLRTLPQAPGLARFWDTAVLGGYSGGLLGPVFLLIPLSLVALRWAEGRRLLLAALLFGWPAVSNAGSRFLMQMIPFATLALALVLSKIPWALVTVTTASFVLSWPAVVNLYAPPWGWRLKDWPVTAALRLLPESQILKQRLGEQYNLVQLIETNVPNGGRVFTFGGDPPKSYVNRPVVIYYQSAFAEKTWRMLWRPVIKDWAPSARMKFSFAPHLVRHLRVLQTANGSDEWSIAEFRIFHGSEELARAPEWRLQATPNPWDVRLAFDGNPVTLWGSTRPIQPGMWMAVDLGRERTIDSVILDCAHDQRQVRLLLQEQTSPGAWRTISDSPSTYDERNESWNLRRAATEEAKRWGITHLLIRNSARDAGDFARHPARWGISFLGQADEYRLYSIW